MRRTVEVLAAAALYLAGMAGAAAPAHAQVQPSQGSSGASADVEDEADVLLDTALNLSLISEIRAGLEALLEADVYADLEVEMGSDDDLVRLPTATVPDTSVR